MKLLILREKDCDFTEVLESCDVEIDKLSLKEAIHIIMKTLPLQEYLTL